MIARAATDAKRQHKLELEQALLQVCSRAARPLGVRGGCDHSRWRAAVAFGFAREAG